MTIPWANIIGIILAACGLAFLNLIETALVSVSRVRLRQLSEQGHPTAPLVERLTERPQELLVALVIAVNTLVLLAANLTTVTARQLYGNSAVVWVDLLVLIGLLVLCDITPKTFSVFFAEPIALRTARIAYLLTRVLSPLVKVLTAISLLWLRTLTALQILPGRVTAERTAFSDEDLKELVTVGEQSGEVERVEREMIHGVIEFADTMAHEVMVPRTDVVALPADVPLEDAVETFVSTGHSRIPVYQDTADNIIGILYIKDILLRLKLFSDGIERAPKIIEILRPAFFVPESKKIDELLREMQRKRVHMAIVVDEYGGTAGMITIEDLLEEIVGDIVDEYDTERLEVVMQPDGSALVSGRASLEKIQETFDIDMPEDTEAETISGLVTEIVGHIPEVGDRAVIGGVEFTVTEVTHKRAERLRAVRLPEDEAPEEEE